MQVELTGEDVTECPDGECEPAAEDLPQAYRSQVDPRLSYEQALEMTLPITDWMGPSSTTGS